MFSSCDTGLIPRLPKVTTLLFHLRIKLESQWFFLLRSLKGSGWNQWIWQLPPCFHLNDTAICISAVNECLYFKSKACRLGCPLRNPFWAFIPCQGHRSCVPQISLAPECQFCEMTGLCTGQRNNNSSESNKEALLKGCPLAHLLDRSFIHQKLRLCYGHGPGCGCGESVAVFSGSFGFEYTKMSFPHMAGSMLLPSLGTGSTRNSRRHEDTVCGLGTASWVTRYRQVWATPSRRRGGSESLTHDPLRWCTRKQVALLEG